MNPIQVAIRGHLGACLESGEYVAQVDDERDIAGGHVNFNDEVLDVSALAFVFGCRAVDVQIGLRAGMARQHQQIAVVIESVVVV